jgi:tRNA G46 methylase TrmB
MFNSEIYWENRYLNGGNSGSGSYGKLALFKADVINNFIKNNNVNVIIDYGVGDGNQLKLIDTEKKKYIGIDISHTILNNCKKTFIKDNTKTFLHAENINDNLKGDLVISCDVIYHLIEDDVYMEYMKNLFNMSNKYVMIYSKNENLNHLQHVKFRKFEEYINVNCHGWSLIKHIPNKYPQLIIGQDNENTSPSDFYIYEKDIIYYNLIINFRKYIQNNLLPIVQNLNVELEGNIYSAHKSLNESDDLSDKKYNFYKLFNVIKPKKILEIGFNAGFSTLFMKMLDPEINITCVDLNEHKYVLPCFDKLTSDFVNLYLFPYSSYDIALPKLIKNNEKYDLIHIDGDHRMEGAKKDLELCLQLSNIGTIIIFDDTNLVHLNNLCNDFIKNGLLIEYKLNGFKNNQKYKHRFLQVIKNN